MVNCNVQALAAKRSGGAAGRQSMRPAWALLMASLALGVGAAGALQAEEIKVPVSRDVWLSAADAKESDCNMGAAPKMKLKVWQEFAIVDFDMAALKGKKIVSTDLYVFPLPGKVNKEGTDLRWITMSTVTSQWVEGKGTDYVNDPEGKGATFNEASYQTRPWAWPGSKAFDVVLGNGNSLRCETEITPDKDGWYKIPVRLDLVQSLMAGGSYGLFVMDGSTSPNINSYVCQREETGKEPFLLVQVDGEDKQAPAAVAGLKVSPAPNSADSQHGALKVSLQCPADVAALQILVDGKELPRYLIPQPKAGVMNFNLLDQTPGATVKVEVFAVDAAGNRSEAATAQGAVSPAIAVPQLPAPTWKAKGGTIPTIDEKLRVWAVPELAKTDPKTGVSRFEKNGADFSKQNAIFDGADSTIHLPAARGELVSFQLVVEAVKGVLSNVTIELSDLKQADKTIATQSTRLWRIWYVDGEAEYAVPLGKSFDVPAKDNLTQGQTTQQITVDIPMPLDAAPGLYKGTVTVAVGESKAVLPLEIKLYSAVIPETLTFNPELNTYGVPGGGDLKAYHDFHRLAHYHRCTLNVVPYSQSGKSKAPLFPVADEKGHVTDWTEYDQAVGPLLTGSAFKDNPRSGVPVRTFYLPQFENWPAQLRKHYDAGPKVKLPDAPTDDRSWKEIHDVYAPPIEKCFDEAYKKAFVTNVREFAEHFVKMGYTKSTCEHFLNNKYSTGEGRSSLWILDEPVEYLDWAAMKFFAELFIEGAKDLKQKDFFVVRGDISRPNWQGNFGDSWMHYLYCNSGAFKMARLVRNTKERSGMAVYIYGSASAPTRNNLETTAWCYQALALTDANGVLPWQSIGNASNLTQLGDKAQLALLIDGKPVGQSAVASLRVHALRRGAQDAELLMALRNKNGWACAHLEALVRQKINLDSKFKQASVDDAAAVTFEDLTAESFLAIREGVLQMLEK